MPDSLVAKWLVRPLAAASVVSVGSSGGLPTSVGSTTTTTAPGAAVVPATKIGINLMIPDFTTPSRPFANLNLSSFWLIKSAANDPESTYYDANGNLTRVAAGDNIMIALSRPTGVYRGKSVDVVCRWTGKATLEVMKNGSSLNPVVRANEARFTYVKSAATAILHLLTVDAGQPFGNLDCREVGANTSAVFDVDYVAFLKRFTTIRFMDWQKTNASKAVTWATRSRLVGQNIVWGNDGYPLELMIDLANATHTNPWFTIPWNADDDYVRKFAELVRDRLDPTLVVYVEPSNEVWNWYFNVAQQAGQEGLNEGLAGDKFQANVLRYAEKLGQVMDIWSQSFAGQQQRLVRVASWQAANPDAFKTILAFRNTATKVDALASAPYLDYDLDAKPVTMADLSPVFTQLTGRIAMMVTNQAKIRATAAQYGGKRVITYEAGQHVTGLNTDANINYAIQHDARMGNIYTAYLRAWQQNSGDLMMLFNDYYSTSKYGAWGLLDDAGQAPGSTAKGKAVTLFQASISK